MRTAVCALALALISVRLVAADAQVDLHPPVTIGTGATAIEVRTQRVPGRIGVIRTMTPQAAGARQGRGAAPAPQRPLSMVGDHLIVRFAPAADTRLVVMGAGQGGMALVHRIYGDLWTVSFPVTAADSFDKSMMALRQTPGVVTCEPDYIISMNQVPNDARLGEQWSLRNTGQNGGTPGADINATAAWDRTIGSRSVLVGVIDSGIDYTHPDLAANLWVNAGETGLDAQGHDKRSNGKDDDGNGFIDDWHGWNFVEDNNDPMDRFGHGTHCAGSIGATGGNGIGIAGVSQLVSLVGIRFLDENGSGQLSDAIAAIDYATRIGCHITSNSWGSMGYSAELETVIRAADTAGRIFVAAAGNNTTDTDVTTFSPGSLPVPNLISVMATDRMDQMALFSNYGLLSCHIAAPGVDILSTKPGGNYQLLSGTSMATPHVAGACALVKALYPGAGASEIKARVLRGARPMQMPCASGGILDCAAALTTRTGAFPTIADLQILRGGQTTSLIRAGEALTVRARVVNIGNALASSLNLLLEPLDDPSAAVIDAGSTTISNLAPSAWLDNSQLAFHVSSSATPETTIRLRVTVRVGTTPIDSRTLAVAVHNLSSVAGRVTSAVDGSPIQGANVQSYLSYGGGSLQRTTTDADGYYFFHGMVDGYYHFDCWGWDGWLYTSQYTNVPRSQPFDFSLQPCISIRLTWDQGVSVEQGRIYHNRMNIRNAGQASGTWKHIAAGVLEEMGGLWHLAPGVSHNSSDDSCFAYVLAGTASSATGAANSGSLRFKNWDSFGNPLQLQFWERGTVALAGGTCTCEASFDGSSWTPLWTSSHDDGVWRQVVVSLPGIPSQDLQIRWVAQRNATPVGTDGGWYIDEPKLVLPFDSQNNLTPWNRLTPGQGTLAVGQTQQVDLDISAQGLQPGDYMGSPQLNDANSMTLPFIRWTVLAAPVIAVGQAGLDTPDGALVADGVAVPALALLVNQGAMTANGLDVQFQSDQPGLHISGGTWKPPALATGTSIFAKPWTVSADVGYGGPADTTVQIVIKDGTGRIWTHPVAIHVFSPSSAPPPTVTVTRAPANPSRATPLTWELTWSEQVTGFTAEDLVLSGATSAVLTPVSPNNDGFATVFTLDVTPTRDGEVSFNLAAMAVANAVGSRSAAVTRLGTTVSDRTPPIITLSSALAMVPPSGSTTVTLRFSESVAAVDATAFTVTGGAIGSAITGGGTTWSIWVTAGATPGTMTVTLAAGAAHDTAGNDSTSGAIVINIGSGGSSGNTGGGGGGGGSGCGVGAGLAALLILVAGFLQVGLRRLRPWRSD